MADLERTYTTEEVARYYHRSVKTIKQWVRDGAIAAIKPGHTSPCVFRQKDLDEFDARNLVGAAQKK